MTGFQSVGYRLDVMCLECGQGPDPDCPVDPDTTLVEDMALGALYNCASGLHQFHIPFEQAVVARGTLGHLPQPGETIALHPVQTDPPTPQPTS